ncbi:MAG: hypothetical protein P4L50_23710 [Anaerolineaceae bacterium]|nr:hypothetical protein [Anaerolineaceae bacterium]
MRSKTRNRQANSSSKTNSCSISNCSGKQTIEVPATVEVTQIVEVTPTLLPATPTIPGPATTFADGTWTVGKDIAPGIYTATPIEHCIWSRLKQVPRKVLETEMVDSGSLTKATILTTDDVFVSVGCGIWTAASASSIATVVPAALKTSFSDGTYAINKDIAPGTYTTTVPTDSSNCYWERVKGFSGDNNDILANNNVNPGATAIVTINKNDAGFTSDGCGTWTLKQ